MKKLILALLVTMLTLSACTLAKDADNTPFSEDEITVSLGYSLDQFGLKVTDKTTLYTRTCDYSEDVNVNGDYTEIYNKTAAQPVLVAAVQGFYKKDLKDGKVFINGYTYTEKTLKDKILYEDDQLVVYDISAYVYADVIADSGIEATPVTASDILRGIIVQKNPGKGLPNPVEKVRTTPADEVIIL